MRCFLVAEDMKFQGSVRKWTNNPCWKPIVGVNQPASVACRVRDHFEAELAGSFGRKPSGDA